MKKEKVKKVLIPNAVHRFTEVEVTESSPEIYKVTFVYADGLVEEESYRSFLDDDDAYRYCMELYERTHDCVECFCELIAKIDFGGNENE